MTSSPARSCATRPSKEPDPEIGSYKLKEAFGHLRTYRTVEDALARFRTVPAQENYLDYVMDHVGRRSMKQVEGGWQWKFDRHIFEQFSTGLRGIALPYLSSVQCRLALLRSENGLVTDDISESMYEAMGRVTPVVEIPLAGHHAMLDEPLILLTAIRRCWPTGITPSPLSSVAEACRRSRCDGRPWSLDGPVPTDRVGRMGPSQ